MKNQCKIRALAIFVICLMPHPFAGCSPGIEGRSIGLAEGSNRGQIACFEPQNGQKSPFGGLRPVRRVVRMKRPSAFVAAVVIAWAGVVAVGLFHRLFSSAMAPAAQRLHRSIEEQLAAAVVALDMVTDCRAFGSAVSQAHRAQRKLHQLTAPSPKPPSAVVQF
jgi:hypothetical protein